MRTEFVFITKRSLLYVKVFTCGEHKECYRWKQRKPQPSVEGYPSASKQLPCTLWVHYSLPFSSKVPVKVGFTKFHQKFWWKFWSKHHSLAIQVLNSILVLQILLSVQKELQEKTKNSEILRWKYGGGEKIRGTPIPEWMYRFL